jgi:hypothetical protein
MNEQDFYLQCAIAAMQGIQEMGGTMGKVLELTPEIIAKHSFDIADVMLNELRKRKYFDK